ncbi:EAL domain-containing protein [Sphingomonas sp.]|uniref:EAL domain-containing protein n=1 Tax=Sphingomonas sp. TaxID=28214 RepID=UPI0025E9ED5A|nr:EAL domain-containing protein [Sphingomonas sp.]MBV9529444.1 EAL domain-containing protein [Sphingomonas sp.]
MLTWANVLQWGKGTADAGAGPATNHSDPLLESMIANEQIDVLYQPQIEPVTGRILAAEALARSPIAQSADMLFERAARAGLHEQLSRVVQRKALRAAAAWSGPLAGLGISLNLLPQEISRVGHDQWLLEEVGHCGIDPRRVTVEITESALLADEAAAAERLLRLRDAGFRIAVDDFGTGYASLAYLISLPLDLIKIDRRLVCDIVGGARDRIVLRALIQLARELDLKVIVEGVESTSQLALLVDWGCECYQGFLAAGALTEEELWRFVTASLVEAA